MALAQHHAVAGRLEFWQGWTATLGSHNMGYVNHNGRLPFKVCHSPLPPCFVISFAQQALRKPVCAGTATAVVVAFFVNREWATAGYENRRKTSSGGQRI